MEWLQQNWFWVVVFVAFIAMHLFGHRGHGGGGCGHGGRGRPDGGENGAAGKSPAKTGDHQH